jgi:hypothetical protein
VKPRLKIISQSFSAGKSLNAKGTAAEQLTSLLGYVEQVVRLDERAAMRLAEHRLPTGQSFIVYQHEVHALPGVSHDLLDEGGPIWLSVERLRRGLPPAPIEEAFDWLEISPDPERAPVLRDHLIRTVSEEQREELEKSGAIRHEDCAESMITKAAGIPHWDIRLRLEDRPEIHEAARVWIETVWLPWSTAERQVRRTLILYQRLFEIAQLAEMGGGQMPFELVWGIGHCRWRFDGNDIDLPLIEWLVEIDLDEAAGTIRLRPRRAAAVANLRAFDSVGVKGVSLAHDAARRAIAAYDSENGISPFQREGFEPVLRACQARLDAEGIYLPDRAALPPDQALPAVDDRLSVSDRWVLFARRRSDSFLLADLEKLKLSIERAAQEDSLPGPAKTLVMGPADAPSDNTWAPLSDQVGASGNDDEIRIALTSEIGDLFFPKPFNDEQIEIVRRLERSDGIVVQGPPGTGKTHTISNIICHSMATGRRVLVVSHGEPALAVLRDQLPDSVRDLAISITTTEREGLRPLIGRSTSLLCRNSRLPSETCVRKNLPRKSSQRRQGSNGSRTGRMYHRLTAHRWTTLWNDCGPPASPWDRDSNTSGGFCRPWMTCRMVMPLRGFTQISCDRRRTVRLPLAIPVKGVDQKLLAMRTGCAHRSFEENQELTQGQRSLFVDLIALEPPDLYKF